MHASMVATSASAGTATIAIVTSSGMSTTDAKALRPPTVKWRGLTGYTGPEKRKALRHSSLPMLPGTSEAPMTAIDLGSSRRATARLSARCSRPSTESTNDSVSTSGNSTSVNPLSKCFSTGHPARLNTVTIARLSASVSAVKRVMPLERAIDARCSSRIVAMPRPWCPASTMNATSASSRPCQRS